LSHDTSKSFFNYLKQNKIDIPYLNKKLFAFLNDRATEAVFTEVLKQDKSILQRNSIRSWSAKYEDKIRLHARAYKLRQLPESIRAITAKYLEDAIIENLDSCIFDEDEILSLIQPTRLVSIIAKINAEIKNAISDRIEYIEENAVLNIEPEDNFEDIKRFLSDMKILLAEGDDEICQRIDQLDEQVDEAISRVRDQKQELDEVWDGEDIIPVKVNAPLGARSLYSDIDE
ncbi:MAG: hypothetical protein ACU83O_14470, partial [Gammaproteobacteria bacterium]